MFARWRRRSKPSSPGGANGRGFCSRHGGSSRPSVPGAVVLRATRKCTHRCAGRREATVGPRLAKRINLMCGIYGIVQLDGTVAPVDLLAPMGKVTIHRGPDDEGVYADG